MEKIFIKSYKLLTTSADTIANFDLILITDYADSSQFKLNEERFQQIIKETRPDGLRLLNQLKPNDFRQNVFFKKTETLLTKIIIGIYVFVLVVSLGSLLVDNLYFILQNYLNMYILL